MAGGEHRESVRMALLDRESVASAASAGCKKTGVLPSFPQLNSGDDPQTRNTKGGTIDLLSSPAFFPKSRGKSGHHHLIFARATTIKRPRWLCSTLAFQQPRSQSLASLCVIGFVGTEERPVLVLLHTWVRVR